MLNSNKSAVLCFLDYESKYKVCWIVSHVHLHPYHFLLMKYVKLQSTMSQPIRCKGNHLNKFVFKFTGQFLIRRTQVSLKLRRANHMCTIVNDYRIWLGMYRFIPTLGDFCISEKKCCKGKCGVLQCLAAVKKVCILPIDFEEI